MRGRGEWPTIGIRWFGSTVIGVTAGARTRALRWHRAESPKEETILGPPGIVPRAEWLIARKKPVVRGRVLTRLRDRPGSLLREPAPAALASFVTARPPV